eukprot:g31637.t1
MAQHLMKQEADKKSKIWMFAHGDKVLMLLPVKEVEAIFQEDIIKLSQSEWRLPIVLVPKPDGTQRFCMDYWSVNAVTKLGSYPIPRVKDCVEKVGQAAYIINLDLLRGYCYSRKDHMVHLAELFEGLREAKLAINLAKTEFVKAEVTFLGHNIGHGRMTLRNVKSKAVKEFLRPSSKKE